MTTVWIICFNYNGIIITFLDIVMQNCIHHGDDCRMYNRGGHGSGVTFYFRHQQESACSL